MNITHTLKSAWNYHDPAVERYSLLLPINATIWATLSFWCYLVYINLFPKKTIYWWGNLRNTVITFIIFDKKNVVKQYLLHSYLVVLRITQIFLCPLWFEITRLNCIWQSVSVYIKTWSFSTFFNFYLLWLLHRNSLIFITILDLVLRLDCMNWLLISKYRYSILKASLDWNKN